VADCPGGQPVGDSPGSPSSAAPAPGNAPTGQASGEAAGGTAADNGNGGVLGKSRSGIWEHYDKLPDHNGTKLVRCRCCARQDVSSNSSTGNMWRHVKHQHPTRLRAPGSTGQTGEPDTGSQGPVYSHALFREMLVEWVVAEDQPFTAPEAEGFRKMLRLASPDAKVPSADTIRRDIDRRFCEEKARVRAVLQDAPGRLSFAIDAWTSPNMQAFLGITVHWIDAQWQLHHLLLDMPLLSGRHSGENLCATFEATCRDFGVLPKLLATTTDNASNNDTFLGHLETACQQQGIRFSRGSMHVRCIAHAINLAVQSFLEVLGSAALDSEDAYSEHYTADARPVGFIPRLRNLVVKVRGSPQRRERFAHQCKGAGIHPKELLVDVRTRWNSTHDMIERALELREPLDIMATLDPAWPSTS
jgi:hypothetical protein